MLKKNQKTFHFPLRKQNKKIASYVIDLILNRNVINNWFLTSLYQSYEALLVYHYVLKSDSLQTLQLDWFSCEVLAHAKSPAGFMSDR